MAQIETQPQFTPMSGIGTLSPNKQWKFTTSGWQSVPIVPVVPVATPKPVNQPLVSPKVAEPPIQLPLAKIDNSSQDNIQNAAIIAMGNAKSQAEFQQAEQQRLAELKKQTETAQTTQQTWLQKLISPQDKTAEQLTEKKLQEYQVPETFQKSQALIPEIDALSTRLINLQTEEATQTAKIQDNAQFSQDFADRETNRIQRNYAIRQAGVSAEIGVKTALYNAYNGQIQTAKGIVSDIVDNMVRDTAMTADNIKTFLAVNQDFIGSLDAESKSILSDISNYWADKEKQDREDYTAKLNLVVENRLSLSVTDIQRMTLEEVTSMASNAPIVTKTDPTLEAIRLLTLQNLSEKMGVGQPLQITSNIPQANSLSNAFNTAMTGTTFTSDDRIMNQRMVENLINYGQIEQAAELIVDLGVKGQGTIAYQSYITRNTGLSQFADIKQELADFVAKGGDTNFFVGTEQQILNKIGKTKNTDLARIGNKIMNTLITFRRQATGVQFSQREQENYSQMFPSVGKEQGYNLGAIDGMMQSMNISQAEQIKAAIGSNNYDALFGVQPNFTTLSGQNVYIPPSEQNVENQGTTLMTGPDGKKWNVPNEKVNLFKQNGYKI